MTEPEKATPEQQKAIVNGFLISMGVIIIIGIVVIIWISKKA